MAYLLDTSVFLNAIVAPERLNRRAQELLSQQAQTFFLSSASSWEIAIKYASGKLRIPDAPVQWVPAAMRRLGAHPLDISHQHALAVPDLPALHQDPFDRILIVQANAEELVLLTSDRIFEKYSVEIFPCSP